MGYAQTIVLETAAATTLVGLMIFANTFYLGICWYIETVLDDVMSAFADLDRLCKNVNVESFQFEVKKVIQFHNIIIKYFKIFVLIVWAELLNSLHYL